MNQANFTFGSINSRRRAGRTGFRYTMVFVNSCLGWLVVANCVEVFDMSVLRGWLAASSPSLTFQPNIARCVIFKEM